MNDLDKLMDRLEVRRDRIDEQRDVFDEDIAETDEPRFENRDLDLDEDSFGGQRQSP